MESYPSQGFTAIKAIRSIMEAFIEMPENEQPRIGGGYLTIMRKNEGKFSTFPIGNISSATSGLLALISIKQALRHYQGKIHHGCGVIGIRDRILSLATSSYQADQAILLVFLSEMGFFSPGQLVHISEVTGNKALHKLFYHYHRP